MKKIAALFTCYNRIEKTKNCVESVERAAAEAGAEIEWFVIDGGSKDDTVRALESKSNMHVRVATNAYYSQGMRFCMDMLDKWVADFQQEFDYVLLINDDVNFYDDFLKRMMEFTSKFISDGLSGMFSIVGAVSDGSKQSYGGIRYRAFNSKKSAEKSAVKRRKPIFLSVKYDMVKTTDEDLSCHTFNANCVLIPWDIYQISPRFDEMFVHSLGDFDYGMCLKGDIYSTDFYVGECENNPSAGTWMDKSLTKSERIRKLNSIKGSPTKQWSYYLKKHFGPVTAAVYSVSPYVRILCGR